MISNKILATKNSKTPVIAKCMLNGKQVLYSIFSGEDVAIQVPWKGKSITGKYYKDGVLKKLKKYYQKRHPVTGFKHVWHLHDNAPTHTSAMVTNFLQKEKVTVLPHPLYSPNFFPCDFFTFSEMENFPHWTEISVQTDAWIWHIPVLYLSYWDYFEGIK